MMELKGLGMRAPVLIALLAGLAALAAEPRLSPPFTIQRVGGDKPLTLASYRGKIVLLALISTTCPHCQDLTGELIPIAREYAPRGVEVLECAINDEAPSDLPGFLARFQPPFPVGFSSRDQVDAYLGRSVVDTRPFYVPHLVFLDRRGFIQGDFAGESDFMKNAADNARLELEKLLQAGAPAPKGTGGAGATAPPSHP
jgi:thiol-disulfide isomerase/thioredoxin